MCVILGRDILSGTSYIRKEVFTGFVGKDYMDSRFLIQN